MFTGIVDHIAVLEAQELLPEGGCVLEIATQFKELQIGESVAINGICLTVTAFHSGKMQAWLSSETCVKTQAHRFSVGDPVNVERALRLQDHLGGHWVTGHVDGVITVQTIQHLGEFLQVDFALPPEAVCYVVPKGSVTINGVSLTINQVGSDRFSVMLIPETQKRTNLSDLLPEVVVQVEWDYIAKIVQKNISYYLPNLHTLLPYASTE